jgi:hypothetical protein
VSASDDTEPAGRSATSKVSAAADRDSVSASDYREPGRSATSKVSAAADRDSVSTSYYREPGRWASSKASVTDDIFGVSDEEDQVVSFSAKRSSQGGGFTTSKVHSGADDDDPFADDCDQEEQIFSSSANSSSTAIYKQRLYSDYKHQGEGKGKVGSSINRSNSRGVGLSGGRALVGSSRVLTHSLHAPSLIANRGIVPSCFLDMDTASLMSSNEILSKVSTGKITIIHHKSTRHENDREVVGNTLTDSDSDSDYVDNEEEAEQQYKLQKEDKKHLESKEFYVVLEELDCYVEVNEQADKMLCENARIVFLQLRDKVRKLSIYQILVLCGKLFIL